MRNARWLLVLLWGVNVCAASESSSPDTLLLTGTIGAKYAQKLRVPPTVGWRAQIRWLAEEGASVRAGAVVVRLDAASLTGEIEQLEVRQRQSTQQANRDLADLRVKVIEAEQALAEARIASAKAQIDAEVPRVHRSALEYDRMQAEFQRAQAQVAQAAAKHAAAVAAVEKRRRETELDSQAVALDLQRKRDALAASELRAEHGGVVAYGTNKMTGEKIFNGGTVSFSQVIAEVTATEDLIATAWVNEADILRMPRQGPVALRLDANPQVELSGRIVAVAAAAGEKKEWGDGRYFEVEIALENAAGQRLTPGMSVQAEVLAQPLPVATQAAP